jgi:outer membrane protein OmpA-like peptidoglycan-associated protein
MGEPGPAGPPGPPGPLGPANHWFSFQEFSFDNNAYDLSASQIERVKQLAVYLKENPSLKCGIDVTDANDRRAKSIRDLLIDSGVPATSITFGAYGDKQFRRNGRIELFIGT